MTGWAALGRGEKRPADPAVLQAVSAVGQHRLMRTWQEGLEPHAVPEVWVMALGDPTAGIAVDTTDTFEAKLAALRCHESQVGEGEHLRPLLEEWGSALARAAGLPEGRTAETFRVLATA